MQEIQKDQCAMMRLNIVRRGHCKLNTEYSAASVIPEKLGSTIDARKTYHLKLNGVSQ